MVKVAYCNNNNYNNNLSPVAEVWQKVNFGPWSERQRILIQSCLSIVHPYLSNKALCFSHCRQIRYDRIRLTDWQTVNHSKAKLPLQEICLCWDRQTDVLNIRQSSCASFQRPSAWFLSSHSCWLLLDHCLDCLLNGNCRSKSCVETNTKSHGLLVKQGHLYHIALVDHRFLKWLG